MARVIGVDLPNNKRLEIGLTYIFGVGNTTAKKICADLDLDPGMKVRDLTEEQTQTLASHIQSTYDVEGELRRQLAQAISRLRDIGCYRGPPPPPQPPCPRPADPHERTFPQGTEEDRRRQEVGQGRQVGPAPNAPALNAHCI